MADHDKVVAAVHSLRQKLCADPVPQERQILKILRHLDRLPITVEVLQETGIGKAVNKLRRYGGDITVAVKGLIQGWKELVRKAMEAEQQMEAEAEHSPAADNARYEEEEERRGEEEEEGEEEEMEQEEQDEGDMMDEEEKEEEGDGESYTGSDTSASQSENERDAPSLSGEESPHYDSPPCATIREPKYPQKSDRSSIKDSSIHHRYHDSDQERTSQKRRHEHSPSQSQGRQHLSSLHSSVHAAKKKRVEENITSKNLAGPKKVKKSALEDSVRAPDLFQNPHKLGSQPLASSTKSTSVDKVRSSDIEKGRSSPGRRDQQLSHSPAKNSAHGSKFTQVDQTKQKKANTASDVKRPGGRSEDIAMINGTAKMSDPSVSARGKPPSGQNTSTPKSTAVKVPSKKPSSLSESNRLENDLTAHRRETKSETHRTKDKLLSKGQGKSSIRSESRPKPSSSLSSVSSSPSVTANKSSAIQGNVTHRESTTAVDGEETQRRLSSGGANSGDDEQNFHNTGMSFADCLMGHMPSGKPKKVKRLNNGAAAVSTKKVSTTKVPKSTKSSSKQTTSSSSSSKSATSVGSKSSKGVQSSSKSGVRESSGSSKSKKPSASGKEKGKVAPREKVKKESQGLPKELVAQRTQTREEDSHQGITLNLPEISADYKPLRLPELSAKKKVLGPSDEGSYIGSKHARTKVFSGKARSTWRYVPTLFESCMRILLDNIDALDEIGVPYDIIKPILEKCTPQQLLRLEDFNPYLVEDTDPLWRVHADRDFKNHRPSDFETWRELYLRKMDEREERLKNVTASISAAMAKKDPGRLTKMAFVNGPAKPPRNVMRQQVRHGTGRINSAPPSNTHKSYVPSKHVGDRPSSHTLSASASSTVRSSSGSGSGGGGGGGGSGSYDNSLGGSGGGGRMSAPRAKTPKAPMMQKALKMKKLFRR